MRQKIDAKSEAEGLPESRLPRFTPEWTAKVNGSWDFLGLNHYTTFLTKRGEDERVGFHRDQDTIREHHPDWPETGSSWLRVVPWGLRNLLQWIKKTYGNPPVYVTENGCSDVDEDVGLNDVGRIEYYRSYINQMLKAVQEDDCGVRSYTAWSLMDNFGGARGYA